MISEPIEILYEDEDLIVVWKEAGLVVHPSHGHYADTLSNRVHAYFAVCAHEQAWHVQASAIESAAAAGLEEVTIDRERKPL